MNRRFFLPLLILTLALALCACSKGKQADDAAPETDAPPSAAAQSAPSEAEATDDPYDLMAQPTLEPVELMPVENADDVAQAATLPTSVPAIDIGAYRFSALTDTALGFTFNYPSDWENVPGTFTICFRQKGEEGSIPIRVAISRKKMVHSVEGDTLTDELTTFVRTISRYYDTSTFQLGTVNREDTFMGTHAVSSTYLAYSGSTEVKGFIIGCAIEKNIYVFHFSASYSDYAAMDSIMRYMCNSVRLVES